MTGRVQIKEPFRDFKFTGPRFLQCQELFRGKRYERDVLRQRVLAYVAIQVSDLQALQIISEMISGQESLLQRIPVAEPDETGLTIFEPELMLHAALRSLRQVVCELIALEIEAGDLTNHPQSPSEVILSR